MEFRHQECTFKLKKRGKNEVTSIKRYVVGTFSDWYGKTEGYEKMGL